MQSHIRIALNRLDLPGHHDEFWSIKDVGAVSAAALYLATDTVSLSGKAEKRDAFKIFGDLWHHNQAKKTVCSLSIIGPKLSRRDGEQQSFIVVACWVTTNQFLGLQLPESQDLYGMLLTEFVEQASRVTSIETLMKAQPVIQPGAALPGSQGTPACRM
jgi:hypothetical protein